MVLLGLTLYRMNWTEFTEYIREKLIVDRRLLVVYVLLYFTWGMGMDAFGQWAEIARFTYWWQVITCYVLYMIPISLLLRKLVWHMQYAYGLIAMGVLEFLGYWLETSYAYPNNLLDQIFGIRNFTLGMALFFGLYFPLGNWAAQSIARKIWGEEVIR